MICEVGNFGFPSKEILRFIYYFTPCVSDLAEINDEAVSMIEAGPRQIHLCGTNGTSSLNVKQASHIHVIGHHMLEPSGHTTLLCRGKRTKYIKISRGSQGAIKIKNIFSWYSALNLRGKTAAEKLCSAGLVFIFKLLKPSQTKHTLNLPHDKFARENHSGSFHYWFEWGFSHPFA